MMQVSKMRNITGQILLLLTTIIPALCQTQIGTSPQTFDVSLGGTAQLPCQVSNLQPSQTVIWFFVDHNLTVSSGYDIRAENYEQKYSIYAPQDVEGFWNLEIYRVDLSDKGSYKCYVSGMEDTVKVVHHLQINEASDSLPAPDLNVTDCCVASSVGPCALPLCDTTSSLVALFTAAQNVQCMEDNLVKVLTCGQDGRNHLGCCMRRGLSDVCLNLCRGYGDNDGTDYSSCTDPVTMLGLVQCFKEGNALLPSPPTGVSAINTGTEVVVTWQSPIDNTDVVVGYKVQYKKKGEAIFNSTKSLPSNAYMETLRNLDLDEVYEIQVIALASSGASQPSLPIFIATREVISSSNFTLTVKDCCKRHNVSLSCQGFCDASLYYTGGHPDILQCDAELDLIYQCVVGQGDHSPCCHRVQVPDVCLGLCRGEPSLSWDIVQCLSYMPLISSCVIEGSTLLPDPPKNTRILAESVTSDSAVVAWQPPDNIKSGDYYRVSWRVDKFQIVNWTSVNVFSGAKYELTGLEPATVYDVVVATVNDKGSSLPELTLLLITEGVSNVPNTPFNETECCMEKGVTGDCLQMCVHQFRMTDQALFQALQCPNAVIPMLVCGTDGRDHTDCCRRINGMPETCYKLCNLPPGSDLSGLTSDFIACAVYKNPLSTCFDEGKAVLPRPPAEVTVKKINVYSVVLDWQAPTGPNITNYTVEQSLDGTFWSEVPSTNHTFLTVDKLKADTVYNFRVISNNENGRSSPSLIIAANTLPVPMNKTKQDWLYLWQNREECCNSSSISTDCQSMCLSGMKEDLDTRKCAGDIDKIIACSADGRDHSECCSKKIPGFSPVCLPYCQGQPGSRNVESALCLTYLGPILTCFTEGQGLLPTPPQSVKAQALSSTEIHLKWDQPASNCNSSCYFITYIWEDSTRNIVQKYKTKEYTYVFSDLKPQTTYRVSVTAYNTNGMSLPSPYFILTTPSSSPHTVSVSQAPSGVVDNGTAVQLECVGLGADIAKVRWIRNSVTMVTKNLYLIKEVSSADQGMYSCEVVFVDSTTKTTELYLNVRYKPVAKKMTEETVLPGVGQNGKLTCEFEGFPDIVTWSKDGNTLQGGSKYDMPTLNADLTSGRTTSYLVVKNVVSSDFGSYMCSGSNKFGEMHSTGSLRNLFPVTPAPSSTPPNNASISDCCHAKGVPDDCARHICLYSVDINNIINDSSLTHCAAFLPEFFACGADGKDHTKCCTSQGVKESCLPFCSGVIPEHDNQLELLVCMPYANILMNCVSNGMENIPSQPRNVHAQVMFDTVRVFWDSPEKNSDKVDVYHVYYQSDSIPKTFDAASKMARWTDLQTDLIRKGETYTVWVIAINDFGSSLASKTATVKVSGLVPPAPGNLQGKALPDSSIDVTWDPPITKLNVEKYALHYNTMGGRKVVVYSIKPSTRLVNLLPDTKYYIYVAGVSLDGEGESSNTVTVQTIQDERPVTLKPEARGGHETVGIAIGVVLGIIFIVAIAIVAVILFRRLARPKSSPGSQTVAFENPHYSTGQRVTGLPGEAENNQFQYGKLQEERDNEHSYMTMQDSHSTDTPATLNLDQA